ncbi:DNA cytosine methyltransferase [Paraburkholderia phytofirmans]|uniref:DNA cytosine methyltransferase n=1 Tax=Paraburkholderia phytofirmans TaxID=261302 RepID=UPI0038B91224
MSLKPKFISLFSGCGGLDSGFIESGFNCVQAFDIDKKVIDVHTRNLGDAGVVADLRDITKEQLLKYGKPAIVVAGSPCQGFSTAGKRDLHDPRNSLLLHAGRLAISVKPRVFIAENVAGALSGEHKAYWLQLEQMLRHAGYHTKTLKLNASNLGLAQLRSRVIMVAWTGSTDPDFKEPESDAQTLGDVLSNMQGLPQHDPRRLARDSSHYLIAKRIGRGQKLCNVRGGKASIHTWDIPEVFGSTTLDERALLHVTMKLRRRERIRDTGDADPVSITSLKREIGAGATNLVKGLVRRGYMRKIDDAYDLANTFNGKYRRLDWNSMSLTVDTRFGDPRYFLHPSEHRSFTVREAARIQGFPDSFIFDGRPVDSYRMIGNAVPPPMAKFIADTIKPLFK